MTLLHLFITAIFSLKLALSERKEIPSDPNVPIITKTYVNYLKSIAPFEVYDYEESPFKDYTYNMLKKRICLIDIDGDINRSEIIPPIINGNQDPPAQFDSRTQWPGCVHPIRDQGNCGSCWAFAASEVLSDRFCIASKGAVNVVLSPQYLIDCDLQEYACNGGYISYSWLFLNTTGVVTDVCYPYFSGTTKARGNCRTSCPASGQTFKRYLAQSGHGRLYSILSAKTHISTNGPIETGMDVYSDLYNYKSGIYEPTTGYYVGGHAVKIVGYGTQDGTDYWIIANSWSTSWGESGFFRIKMTTSRVESQLYVGFANLTALYQDEPNFTFLE